MPPPGSLNVVLITLDTVRADHLSLYGYPRRTSFTLDQLAMRGVRFNRARSSSPWTLPSHGGIFTGRLPHELGADWLGPIGATFPSLAGYLSEHGYSTCGFVGNTLYCGYDTGLASGFTHYEDYTLPEMDAFLMAQLTQKALMGFFRLHSLVKSQLHLGILDGLASFVNTYVFSGKRKTAETVNADFLNWLSLRRQETRPFFAFLNYFDAHDAYFPPGPSNYRFGLRPRTPADFMVLQNWELIDKPSLDEYYKTLAVDCYDDCISYLDEQLNLLISSLGQRAAGPDDSDHYSRSRGGLWRARPLCARREPLSRRGPCALADRDAAALPRDRGRERDDKPVRHARDGRRFARSRLRFAVPRPVAGQTLGPDEGRCRCTGGLGARVSQSGQSQSRALASRAEGRWSRYLSKILII